MAVMMKMMMKRSVTGALREVEAAAAGRTGCETHALLKTGMV
jgi:hypothetical protein